MDNTEMSAGQDALPPGSASRTADENERLHQQPFLVFDGHLDFLLRLWSEKRSFLERHTDGHVDLPRALDGGLGGGLCAIYVPPESGHASADGGTASFLTTIDYSRGPDVVSGPRLEYSQKVAIAMMAVLFRTEKRSNGGVKVVRSVEELEASLDRRVFAAVLHLEGADAIDPELNALEVFYEAGLRSLGFVHARSNVFAHGVPFRFAHSPDTGPGLSEVGRDLVHECNRLRIVIDLSHLNEKGFWDVASLSCGPLVATHSNAFALAASTRNLTDRQLAAIRESDGMVGVTFHTPFVRRDGKAEGDTPIDAIVDHIDYLVDRLGIDGVGMGSDFEYAVVPDEIRDVTGLPKLVTALRNRGYDDLSIRKLTYENWIRVLKETWGM